MRKSIVEAMQVRKTYETGKYIYEKVITPNGFVILRYDREHKDNYPCVVYVQK